MPTKLVWHFSELSTIFYEFLKFTAFELGGGALEFYRDTLNIFEIFALIPLAHRGRRAEGVPAKFRRGDDEGSEEKWSASTRRSRRTCQRSWKKKGMARRGVSTAEEGCSSAMGFPVRRRTKLGLESCSRARGSSWGSRIGERRGGGRVSTVDRSLPAEGERRRGSSGGGPATGNGSGASVEQGETS
jgi:hypothetical protein